MTRHEGPPLSPELILRLQKTVGNRAVQRLLAARTRAAQPSQPIAVVPPPPPPVEAAPAPPAVEVIAVVPDRKLLGWLFVIVRLFGWASGWTKDRLRLKEKSEDT